MSEIEFLQALHVELVRHGALRPEAPPHELEVHHGGLTEPDVLRRLEIDG